jgi:hypothetical protein
MILGHHGLDNCDMARTCGHQLQPLLGTVHVAEQTNTSLPLVFKAIVSSLFAYFNLSTFNWI